MAEDPQPAGVDRHGRQRQGRRQRPKLEIAPLPERGLKQAGPGDADAQKGRPSVQVHPQQFQQRQAPEDAAVRLFSLAEHDEDRQQQEIENLRPLEKRAARQDRRHAQHQRADQGVAP